jgi:hypothetical protein
LASVPENQMGHHTRCLQENSWSPERRQNKTAVPTYLLSLSRRPWR